MEVAMRRLLLALVVALTSLPPAARAEVAIRSYALPAGGGYPHDVAVGADGIVWYTAQRDGRLGRLDPATGKVDLIPLGAGASPHGVIVGPDGAPWITEGGTNSIVRVDPQTREVKRWPLPEGRGWANLNTLTFDKRGRVWFTGQSGVYGRLDPKTGAMQVWDAPRGGGPYGIATTPDGAVYYASLAGSYIARVDLDTGAATVIEPPTRDQGARRVWSDSRGRIWVSEWNAGNVSRYDPGTGAWRTWRLPGERPRAYAVYVDDKDMVWLSDWGANAMVRFDPETEKFEVFRSDRRGAGVRQILGRPGEVWAPESGADRLVVYRAK
ncbi:MAG: SMP-30/gluconolactonase/LRE family protein [Candidatus Rokubacteria bacterium]|nr:SMP-30/gluconolactonase/LRE family protein [Candidatus Rokubacteria bacterium]